ncbi:MAG: DNA mismatch repair endonuclease MutL [Verrucomicrobium sp.]
MSKIRILSDALASQVAAGEVVERPAAVVRELVENSLDAGATHVEVHVQRGGTALIRVTDNGHGMDREDALLCLERHATSKIRTKEDLGSIRTLGFRGEAMPSIASVSRFRLASREPSALSGTEVEVQGGKMVHVRDYGGAPGTMVEARSLFYNIPARRKFLRSEQTEYSHVEQQFRLHAIANPQVAFSLVRDGEVLFHLPATKDLLERIEGLSGREAARRLLEVKRFTLHGVTVSGFISGPGVSRPNRQMQLTFLNGRPVDSATVNFGMREGYHTSLMKGQHPITFLFLEMEPDTFDINVHPAKKEVRFHDGHGMREAVVQAVSRTLADTQGISTGHLPMSAQRAAMPSRQEILEQMPPLIPESEQRALRNDWASFPAWTSRAESTLAAPPAVTPHAPGVEANSPAQSPDTTFPDAAPPPNQAAPPYDGAADLAPPPSPTPPATVEPPPKVSPDSFRIMGVLHKLYVLMESSEGLVLMDQHAAHERVLFEQMRRSMEHEGVPSQRLLLPLTMEVSPRDFDVLSRSLPTLQKLGIEAEPFGANSFKVDAMPAFIRTDDPLALLRDVMDELASASSRTSSLRLGEDMIATTVCRHAVKANDDLRQPELKKLLEDLLACEMPYCCPHGRPTLIQISFAELERKFGRRAP